MLGHLTEKADIFGFGIVALEILSGRPNSDNSLEGDKIYLLKWVSIRQSFFISRTQLFFIAFKKDM